MCENEPNFDNNIFPLKSRRKRSRFTRWESEEPAEEWIQAQYGGVYRLGFKRIIYPIQQCANSAAPHPSKSSHDREVVYRFPKTGMKFDFCVSTQAQKTKTVLLRNKNHGHFDLYCSRINSRMYLKGLRSVLLSWRVAAVWALARSSWANILTRSGIVISLRHQYKSTRSLNSSANSPLYTIYTFTWNHWVRIVILSYFY